MIMIAMLSEVQKHFRKLQMLQVNANWQSCTSNSEASSLFNCLAMTRMAVVLVLVKVAVRVMLVMVSGWMNGWVMQ